ncbi:MAG: hypothetical protein HY055_16110 [Magnetospirillum sp.]|nr:hypothetical protein [Magnetospirillum sp.]
MRLLFLCLCLMLAVMPVQADSVSAIAAVRAQPKVLDAQIDDRGNLFVVVKNENIAWDQYAAYMCALVRPHQARVFVTNIIDMTSVGRGAKPAEWKRLAQLKCS